MAKQLKTFFVALVMITVVAISELEVGCVIFIDVRKHAASCYTALLKGKLERKPTIKQGKEKLPL